MRIAELEQRQQQVLREIELRLAADAERLSAESEEQRAGVARLRTELDRTLEEALGLARSELDVHAAERRRALHELEERMSRRERELTEQAQREEVEAVQRVKAGFEDVSRRQIEQLERAVERAVGVTCRRGRAAVRAAREDVARGRREAARTRARPRREHLFARGRDGARRAARARRRRRRTAARASRRRRSGRSSSGGTTSSSRRRSSA